MLGARSASSAAPRPGAAAPAVPVSATTDAELVPALKAGREDAFEEVVRRYRARVYGLARHLTRNDGDAEDVLQETFLSVYRRIGSFREAASLSTWIYRIAANAALMRIRGRKRRDRTVPIEEFLPKFDRDGHRTASLPDWPRRGDEVLLEKELREHLRGSIRLLAPDYRAVLVLRDVEGLSNAETARVLRISVAAVKSRLHRARLFLRERVKAYWHGTEGLR